MPLSFDHLATKYSPVNALALGYCAKWAYLNEPEVKEKVATELGLTNFRFISIAVSDTEAFVAGDDKKVIVSFRGTETSELKDFLSDIKFDRIYGPLGKVHAGFIQALNSSWREVASTIRQFQDKNQTLWFTGHSLGAALATLGVAKMIEFAYPNGGFIYLWATSCGQSKICRCYESRNG